ncbi:hypothetical protein LA324_05295 [Corynebacterium coyleae]|uniref:hypothetical protein n=1 Tax=Corynebacterium coyleae TaxID=53374 RepID=UPI001CCF80E6|nr:hypothetical protein [Corynebacterium coyleae]UBI10025.1 hypothetical protein LA324_05295 [Corynebacterium coyleae]
MNIIAQGPGFKAWANNDRTEVVIERSGAVQRGDMPGVVDIMSRGAWVAHGLEEREDGSLYERWVRHA